MCSCAMEPQQLPDHSVCAASFGGQKALSPFGGSRLTFGGYPIRCRFPWGTSLDRSGGSYQLSVEQPHGTRHKRKHRCVFCVCLKASNLGLCKKGYRPSKRLCRKILFRSCLWPSERSQSPGLFIPRENWFRHAGSPRYGCFMMLYNGHYYENG